MDELEKQILKDWRFWRDSFFACLLLVVYNVGSLSGMLYFYKIDKLWFPYTFGGMPSFAIGAVGVKWYNQIWLFISATTTMMFGNPIMFALFVGVLWWMILRHRNRKKVWMNYLLVLFIELIMIFTTGWE